MLAIFTFQAIGLHSAFATSLVPCHSRKYTLRCIRLGEATSLDRPQPPASDRTSAADRHQIFEQIALERLRSGGDASKPVGFLPLPVRLTAIAATSITALGVLWACLAKVPIQVAGVASIAPEVQVSSALARSDGVLAYQVSGVGPDLLSPITRQRNQVLSAFWQQAVVNNAPTLPYGRLNALSLAAMAPLTGQRLILPESELSTHPIDDLQSSDVDYSSLHFASSTIIARIDSPSSIEQLDATRRLTLPKLMIDRGIINDRRERFAGYSRVDALLARQRLSQQQELRERDALFQRLQTLWTKGFVSTAQLLQEQAVINGLRNQVMQIERDRLNTEFTGSDQLQQADQAALSSLQQRSQLQSGLVAYMSAVFTITPPSGIYIVSKAVRNGMQVRAGDELFTYSVQKPTLPLVIPVFVDAATSQQLTEGMQVLVTPRGISRAQYGGIPGVVDEVGRLPLPAEGMAAFAGGRTLASNVQQATGGAAYLVRVKLEQADPAYCRQMLSLRCYRWSTSRRPPSPVRLGTLADVQINVQYRRPIDFVMPALRQALGLVVENR